MNKKIIYGLSFLWLFFLAVLFITSSTNLIINENEIKVYNIALILDTGSENYFKTYRAGMDKALKTENIELDLYVLKEPVSVDQQVTILEEICAGDADAVIVKPIDDKLFQKELEKLSVTTPIICLDANVNSDKVALNIHGDNYERGTKLAERIEKDYKNKKVSVYVFGIMKNSTKLSEIYEGLENYMSDAGYNVLPYCFSEEKRMAEKMDKAIENEETAVFVALDVKTMERMTMKLQNLGGRISVYGFGMTNTILKKLEDKEIKAINIGHEYYMGWLSLRCAIQILERENIKKQLSVENYTVGANDIFSKEYEDILFPLN